MEVNNTLQLKADLAKKLGYKNVWAVPTINKIVINSGIGKYKDDKTFVESAKRDITQVCGQVPGFRKAKKSIAGFKVRTGDIVGLSTTLRGPKMWSFYNKLVSIVLPRFRDFRGLSKKSFDKHGNYTIGIKEHTVFPEIDPNRVDKIKTMEITISTSTNSDEKAYKFLKEIGFPFKD